MNEYPNEIEMEKKLLSAMWLKDGVIIPDVAAIVKAEDFYRVEHRLIYAATVAVYERGDIPDTVLVKEELERRGEFKRIDHIYFHALIDAEFSTARATTYAQKIREAALRRRLIRLSKELIYESGEEMKPISDLVAKVEKMATAITKSTVEQPWGDAKDLIQQGLDAIRARKKNGGLQGLRTGLYDLDEMTGGLKAPDLIILAARPAMGKTALAMNIAMRAARDVPVLIFSLEMSKGQLMDRVYSSFSGVNLTRIINGMTSKDEDNAISDAMGRLDGRKFAIDDTGDLSISELKMRARQFKHQNGLGLIVVDYLQLIRGGIKENRVQEVSEISRGLKALAKELNVPVFALSQLSRNVESRADKKPQLSDLRDSGSIEQDADIVMFLYRPEYYERTEENKNLALITLAKNRNGATGEKVLHFDAETVRFRDALKEKRQ